MGAGAISRWSLELPSAVRQFDYDIISDMVFHMSYTAQNGGDGFKSVVNQYATGAVNAWLVETGAAGEGLFRMISLRQKFGSNLHRFLYPSAEEDLHETTLAMRDKHFPHFLRDYFAAERAEVTEAHLIIRPKDRGNTAYFDGQELFFGREERALSPPDPEGPRTAVHTDDPPLWGGWPAISFTALTGTPEGQWTSRLDPGAWPVELTVEEGGRKRLDPQDVDDVYMIFPLPDRRVVVGKRSRAGRGGITEPRRGLSLDENFVSASTSGPSDKRGVSPCRLRGVSPSMCGSVSLFPFAGSVPA